MGKLLGKKVNISSMSARTLHQFKLDFSQSGFSINCGQFEPKQKSQKSLIRNPIHLDPYHQNRLILLFSSADTTLPSKLRINWLSIFVAIVFSALIRNLGSSGLGVSGSIITNPSSLALFMIAFVSSCCFSNIRSLPTFLSDWHLMASLSLSNLSSNALICLYSSEVLQGSTCVNLTINAKKNPLPNPEQNWSQLFLRQWTGEVRHVVFKLP